ncbi:MAG: sulfotransferase domain-containing protein [Chlamydiae bacterium]|nr:sulfotransferase domain-containing protein [Chlamydiota bacterium]MBI3278014.1 sulfotransferase domain-containing protein [Chlamydiota bacterium]
MPISLPLVWLASYPRSGNTWFRAFLTALLNPEDDAIQLNELLAPPASTHAIFDDAYGIDTHFLTHEEIDQRRAELYESWQQNITEKNRFFRTHDAYTYRSDGSPLLGHFTHQIALYFIRNPLDVAVSFAHLRGVENREDMIDKMNDTTYGFARGNTFFEIPCRQRLLSWSQHVLSWVDEAKMKVHLIRYEDMLNNSLFTFYSAVKFLGLTEYDQAQVKEALESCRFSRLQNQEQESGFRERPKTAKTFFRKGQVGSYREILNQGQIDRLLDAHGSVMQRFDYLDQRGFPVF